MTPVSPAGITSSIGTLGLPLLPILDKVTPFLRTCLPWIHTPRLPWVKMLPGLSRGISKAGISKFDLLVREGLKVLISYNLVYERWMTSTRVQPLMRYSFEPLAATL